MYHKTKLSTQEKIKAWLSLCDFTFGLMKENLTEEKFTQRLTKIREDRIKANHSILKGLSRIK